MIKILLVDHHSETFSQLHELLQQETFQVLVASSFSMAVLLLGQEQPDLILCNLDSLSVDGLDFLRTVREEALTAMTPFIFLSSQITESNRRTGMNLGADDYIALPFSYNEGQLGFCSIVSCRDGGLSDEQIAILEFGMRDLNTQFGKKFLEVNKTQGARKMCQRQRPVGRQLALSDSSLVWQPRPRPRA